MRYKIDTRDYLARARERLNEDKPESLFYAALELRFGIEARLKKYLDANDNLQKKKMKGCQISILSKNVENVFKQRNKLIKLKFYDKVTKQVFVELLYTPVSNKLIKEGEKIGNMLHSKKHYETQDDDWFKMTKEFLECVYKELEISNKGTLLSPPLYNPRTGKLLLNIENYEGYTPYDLSQKTGGEGSQVIFDVSYPESL
jgi:hypothetical protein